MQPAGGDPIRGRWSMGPTSPYGQRLEAPRPTFREPHPIRSGAVFAGIGATVTWFMFFAIVSWSVRSYGWSTIIAGALALLAAVALLRHGDRGVALGVAAVSGFGVGVAGLVVGLSYLAGDWVLW